MAAAAARAARRLLSSSLHTATRRHASASGAAAREASGSFIHPAAVVHPDAAVGQDCTHTAGAVVVHQFCHIGSYSFLGGGSVVAQDVPRYMMVAGDRAELRGLNLEGLRRNGFSNQEEGAAKLLQCLIGNTSGNNKTFVIKEISNALFSTTRHLMVRRLRKAYQKVFMPTSTNESSFENRLAELEQEIELSESPAVSYMVESIRMSFDQGRRGICKFRSWNSS